MKDDDTKRAKMEEGVKNKRRLGCGDRLGVTLPRLQALELIPKFCLRLGFTPDYAPFFGINSFNSILVLLVYCLIFFMEYY